MLQRAILKTLYFFCSAANRAEKENEAGPATGESAANGKPKSAVEESPVLLVDSPPLSIQETKIEIEKDTLGKKIEETIEKEIEAVVEPVKEVIEEKIENLVEATAEKIEGFEENIAATKIQANFRGFQVRKQLKEEVKAVKEVEPELKQVEEQVISQVEEKVGSQVEESLDEEIKAATKIQAGFRGYQTRKQLADKTGKKYQ